VILALVGEFHEEKKKIMTCVSRVLLADWMESPVDGDQVFCIVLA
jgi:hypothetical protein